MTRWLTSSILVLAVVHAVAPTAFAQTFAQDLELNFFLGLSTHTKKNFEIGFPQSITPIPAESRFSRVVRGGIRGNVYTRGHWSEEFYYSYEQNDLHLRRQTTPPVLADLPIQVHNFGVNALYYFIEDEERLTRPFLTFGLGAAVYRPTSETRQIARDPFRANLGDFDQSNEIAFNYGAGVKARMAPHFGLRFDVRHLINRNPTFGIPRRSEDANEIVFPATGAIHNLEASVGIIVYFGR